jgi:hypothetical protein
MNKKLIGVFIIIALMLGACSFGSFSPDVVVGSGKVAHETRSVSNFTSVVLEGSANVSISSGTTESVVVEADDNILPLIETTVKNGQLVIGNKPNTNITTVSPVKVTVTMKSLQSVTLSGSGNVTASGFSGDSLSVNLPGSGNITVTGTTNNLQIKLLGSGNIMCQGLQAKSAIVRLSGSGDIQVYASQSLDASILGSGSILYSGNPSQVNKSVSGSGSITPK